MIKVVKTRDAYLPPSSTLENISSSASTYSGVDKGSLVTEEISVSVTDEKQNIDASSSRQIQTSISEGSTKVCNYPKM